MRRATLCALGLALVIPAALNAQWRRNNRGWQPSTNPFSVEVVGGAYKDALSLNNSSSSIGWLGGLRVGYDVSKQFRLVGTGLVGQTNNVENNTFNGFSQDQFNNQWVMATGGVELTLIPGATSFAIGAQAGGAWERETQSGPDCGGQFGGGCALPTNWAEHTVYVPEATLRQQLTPRMALTVRGSDYIMPNTYGATQQNPMLSVGMQFR